MESDTGATLNSYYKRPNLVIAISFGQDNYLFLTISFFSSFLHDTVHKLDKRTNRSFWWPKDIAITQYLTNILSNILTLPTVEMHCLFAFEVNYYQMINRQRTYGYRIKTIQFKNRLN